MNLKSKIWKQKSRELLFGLGYSDTNYAITARYSYYYLKFPQYASWAGLAAFVSDQVGYSIRALEELENGRDGKFEFSDFLFNKSHIKDLKIVARINKNVFLSIAWAYEVLDSHGPDGLRQVLQVDQDIAPLLKKGLNQMLSANNNQEAIKLSDTLITEYEQSRIVQPGFERIQSNVSRKLSLLTHLDFDANPQRLNLRALTSFRFFAFQKKIRFTRQKRQRPSIKSYKIRWAWIVKIVIPKWVKLKSRESNRINNCLTEFRDRYKVPV